ncbi:hypothetical protein SZ64_13015 [Erythrobacter sp. SG61-1L]|uniref:DUF2460 domain-containing protein n=1 Tax=Erythrobacter sp. SG61-1L TaxID=1603897 RepID=UPI0006C912CC|nr:DUF2460 domain-containing protein [Erythrobacter sp. SG61-1L]KPL68939.1 hypothetical protein SZ64_13015 [Erythrobacter sp. SG61-1L]
MAFWLAARRNGQQTDWLQRFDPRFWTVDFPRPMMASVTTTAPDALRIDAEFFRKSDLAGLIWDSTDRIDHPLLAYETDGDYSRTTLRFRWRSGGIQPLDAANGPTLTIEGRDTTGTPRAWYVRLWNYASGTPEDALVELPFSALDSGWSVSAGADPVNPAAIDRMFISLAPPGYAPGSDDPLPARVDGWAEMSDIACEGHRPMLRIGDVLLPPHGTGIATGYDDCYNQTPARVLRSVRGLGYRGRIVHYLGMSHLFRLVPDGAALLADPAGTLSGPAAAWHADFFRLCAAQGYEAIASLSYEMLAQHCPPAWQQRTFDGMPARTAWSPPSALLSPAHPGANGWLQAVAAQVVALQKVAGLKVLFQIGEPWWWVTPDGRICLYDDAAKAALGGHPPNIPDMRLPLGEAQKALLDDAGALLAASTAALADSVREAAGEAGAEVLLLAFTPTILDPAMPELYRANLPEGWAFPAFDRLQVEDYDWLTAGADGLRRAAYALLDERLGYPADRQDYLAGFVPSAENSEAQWRRIDVGLSQAAARGIARRFVWALPQVARDGFTLLAPPEGDAMQAFDDVHYPLALGRDAGVSPEFSTSITVTASGHECRASHWADARLRFDVGPGIRSEEELGTLIAFFRARRGAARGFLLADPFDCSSNGMTGTPTMLDQKLGTGDGTTASFRLVKHYGGSDDPQTRPITRPRPESVTVSVGGMPASGWTLGEKGLLTFAAAPPAGAEIRAGFLFDVPVRFAEDRLDVTGASFAAGEAPSVPLIEVREAA